MKTGLRFVTVSALLAALAVAAFAPPTAPDPTKPVPWKAASHALS
jgi:hypothetical protein